MLGFLCLILPGIYLFVAWIFTFPLIVDRRLDFWPAMRLSRKIISKHWWKFLGFLIVLGLINLAGMAACCVGLFITFPVTFAALTYAYEDITGVVKSPSSAPSSVAGSPFRRGALAGFAVFFVIVVLAIGVTSSYRGVTWGWRVSNSPMITLNMFKPNARKSNHQIACARWRLI